MHRDPRDKNNALKRTSILSVLVLICVAYILNKRFTAVSSDLASAKDKISHIARQPTAHSSGDGGHGPSLAARTATFDGQPTDDAANASSVGAPPAADDEKKVHLTKGSFTVVDGEIVYGADAQLDIGHGMLVSSPSGVMVSDVDQRHFAGDLVIDSQYGTTTTENAFMSVDSAHVEITSDNSVTVKKDEAK
jgi:hypothetical protein